MAELDEEKRKICSKCGRVVDDLELQACMICRSLFCRRCAIKGFGRHFCSTVCRGFFFHGDGDETKEDF